MIYIYKNKDKISNLIIMMKIIWIIYKMNIISIKPKKNYKKQNHIHKV